MRYGILLLLVGILLVAGCSEPIQEETLFTKIEAGESGILFKNTVTEDTLFNSINYLYFYDGGGVAVGDINNDGLSDIYLTGNMVKNRLYLNRGNMQFVDVTEPAGVGGPLNSWITGTTMVYGSFDFRFAFQGVQGIDLLNNTALEYQRPSNVFNGLNLLADAVDDVADGLDVQANPELSDRFIEDASYLRLQNVTLGYNFNNSFFRNLRVYLSADNLFLLTGYSGLDPEVNTFAGETGPASLGIDYTNYPRARVFTVGMNIGVK